MTVMLKSVFRLACFDVMPSAIEQCGAPTESTGLLRHAQKRLKTTVCTQFDGGTLIV